MTSKASIHIVPVKNSSEKHNLRETKLDYVLEKPKEKNLHWVSTPISQRLQEIKVRCKKLTGRTMQDKATPIREGVLNLKDPSPETMKKLKVLGDKLESKFGIKTIQIHIHADEGHYNKEKKWKPNYHAHMVFDWTDHNTGKSLKLGSKDMCKVQTIVAETLEMERGIPSDKDHLNSIQFKAKAELEKVFELHQELDNMTKRVGELQDEIKEKLDKIDSLDLNQEDLEVRRRLFGIDFGKNKEETEKNYKAMIQKQRKHYEAAVSDLKEKLRYSEMVKEGKENQIESLRNRAIDLQNKVSNQSKVLNSREALEKRIEELKSLEIEKSRNRNFGRSM